MTGMWPLLLIPVGLFCVSAISLAVLRRLANGSGSWWRIPLWVTFGMCFSIPGMLLSIGLPVEWCFRLGACR